MDKYINAVILEPDVKYARFSYLSSCSLHCAEMNQYFRYGDRFVVKCNERCKRKHDAFMGLYEPIHMRLVYRINECHATFSEQRERESLRQCILDEQTKSLNQLKTYIKENINPKNFA